jgi:uncharacterized membrane protein YdbT with pleckstrin-like domain
MIEIDANEHILRVVRKHWFVLLSEIFLLVACLFVPVVVLFVLHVLPVSLSSIVTWSGAAVFGQWFFLFAWIFIVWMIGWTLWTNYYLDVVIVTDKRIFTIEQDGLFRRSSSSFRIDRIQNTTVDQKGIIQTLLNFGTIRLETAGESEDFIGTFIADPYDLKKFINEMQDSALKRSQLVHTDGNTPVADVTPITTHRAGQ